MNGTIFSAFLDELEKIAVSKSQLTVAQARSGRRPISVDNFIKKDNKGTLFKDKKSGYAEGMAPEPKKKGDVPSRDGVSVGGHKTEDVRNHVMIVQGPTAGYYSSDTGATLR